MQSGTLDDLLGMIATSPYALANLFERAAGGGWQANLRLRVPTTENDWGCEFGYGATAYAALFDAMEQVQR
jgi:hypothetical protein